MPHEYKITRTTIVSRQEFIYTASVPTFVGAEVKLPNGFRHQLNFSWANAVHNGSMLLDPLPMLFIHLRADGGASSTDMYQSILDIPITDTGFIGRIDAINSSAYPAGTKIIDVLNNQTGNVFPGDDILFVNQTQGYEEWHKVSKVTTAPDQIYLVEGILNSTNISDQIRFWPRGKRMTTDLNVVGQDLYIRPMVRIAPLGGTDPGIWIEMTVDTETSLAAV